MNGFSLTYEGFDPAEEGLREALTSTGNGYVCTRGAAEWEDDDDLHYPGTYIHGVYNRETTILGGHPVRDDDPRRPSGDQRGPGQPPELVSAQVAH